MKFDILIQFIVPLTFLAIWALTSILNRDAQPLPPRPGGRLPGPGGPQPMNRLPASLVTRQIAPGRPPAPSPPTPVPASERAAGWSGPTPAPLSRDRTPPPKPTSGKLEDAIVYLESEPPAREMIRSSSSSGSGAGGPGLPQPNVRSTRSGSPRRSARGRSTPAGSSPAAKSEPETRRALSDQVGQAMAMERSKPLEIVPLSASMAPLARPLSQISPASSSLMQTPASPPAVSSADVRKMLATPGKLRELVLLSEILQPPLALRRGHRRI